MAAGMAAGMATGIAAGIAPRQTLHWHDAIAFR